MSLEEFLRRLKRFVSWNVPEVARGWDGCQGALSQCLRAVHYVTLPFLLSQELPFPAMPEKSPHPPKKKKKKRRRSAVLIHPLSSSWGFSELLVALESCSGTGTGAVSPPAKSDIVPSLLLAEDGGKKQIKLLEKGGKKSGQCGAS